MGGLGSGSLSDRGGRRKKTTVEFVGTGTPQKPVGLSAEAAAVFDTLAALTAGITFEQDSLAIEQAASLVVRQRALNRELETNPADPELNRLSLAVGRQLMASLAKLGLTPRDRQVLLAPKPDVEPPDPIQEIINRRKERFFSNGTP